MTTEKRYELITLMVSLKRDSNQSTEGFMSSLAILCDADLQLEWDANFSEDYRFGILSGTDCDGSEGVSFYAFKNTEEALNHSQSYNESSDGVLFTVVDIKTAKDYCNDNDLKFYEA